MNTENTKKYPGIISDPTMWQCRDFIYARAEVMMPRLSLFKRIRILFGKSPLDYVDRLHVSMTGVQASDEENAMKKIRTGFPFESGMHPDIWNEKVRHVSEMSWI